MTKVLNKNKFNLVTKKYKACPLCRGEIKTKYSRLIDRLDTVTSEYNISHCLNCGVAFTNPFPVGNLHILYPTYYLSQCKSSGFDLEKWYRYNQYAFDFSILKKYCGLDIGKVNSYLDVGCGSGERVMYVREKGCKKAMGLDKYENLKEAMQGIVNTEIKDFFPVEKFDAVSLFHVLEHVEDLNGVIEHVKKNILKKGGVLIIQVPNYDSWERYIFGKKWFCFDAPRHLWHFDKTFLRNFFKDFIIMGVEERNATLHPVSIASSVNKELDVQRIWVKSVDRSPLLSTLLKMFWIAGTFASVPLNIIQNVFKKASMLTVVLKNDEGS